MLLAHLADVIRLIDSRCVFIGVRFNVKGLRYDWLAHYLFDAIEEVQEYATQWL